MTTLLLAEIDLQISAAEQINNIALESPETWQEVQHYLRSKRSERDKQWLGDRLDYIRSEAVARFYRQPTKEEIAEAMVD